MMRTYYIFKINKYFSYVYKNKPYKIYKTIEEIYHTKEYDMVLTYKIYEQIAIPFIKGELNKYLYEFFLKKNYKEKVVKDIFFDNAYNFFKNKIEF